MIGHDERIEQTGAGYDLPDPFRKGRELRGRLDISREQDYTGGRLLPEISLLVRCQLGAGYAHNEMGRYTVQNTRQSITSL